MTDKSALVISHAAASRGVVITVYILCSILMVGLSGCAGSIKIQRPIHLGDLDWLNYGKDCGRTNRTANVLDPPLRLLWEYDASAGIGTGSPVVMDSIVLFCTLTGELHAVEIATGKRIGYVSAGSSIAGSPAVAEGIIVVASALSDEPVLAFEPHYGNRLWKKLVGAVETSPVIYRDNIFITTVDGVLLCLNRFSGEELWRFETRKPIHSSPSTNGSVVVFGCDNGNLYAVDVRTGKQAWCFNTPSCIFATPSILKDKVYCGSNDGFFYALNLADGSLSWKYCVGAKMYAAPVVSDSLVAFGSTNGLLYALNRLDGSLRWTFRAKSVINSSPVLTGNNVFLGSLDRNIYALNASTGVMLWKYEFEGRIRTSPVVWGQYLIVAAEDKYVYAMGPVFVGANSQNK